MSPILKKSPLAPKAFPVLPPIFGARLATTQCGFKKGRDDLLLIELSPNTEIAGVFTKSSCPAASVEWCRTALQKRDGVRAIVVNSGNANAFTGNAGQEITRSISETLTKLLNCQSHHIFQASTGVIGEPFPSDQITDHLPALIESLDEKNWEEAAKAIGTTDTFPKGATDTVTIQNTKVTINGIAKGSGMIHPNMATMLSFIVTDACIAPALLQEMLEQANEQSFNAITVDSDTSPSDILLLCATGTADHAPLTTMKDARKHFLPALQKIMTDLAHQVVRDGEGAQKFIEIVVSGANSNQSAKKIAFSIANSPLVKTAIAGEDANWGRIIMAIGKSGEPIDQNAIVLSIGPTTIIKDGQLVQNYDETPVTRHIKGSEINIHVNVGPNQGHAKVWTCDLTHGYIDINADYRS